MCYKDREKKGVNTQTKNDIQPLYFLPIATHTRKV